MAEETLRLVPIDTIDGSPVPYVVDFDGEQRLLAGMRYRLGRNSFGEPVALKIAADGSDAATHLRRERQVALYMGPRGGELLAKCLGHSLKEDPAFAVVAYRGRSLAELLRGEEGRSLGHELRMKIITDLLQGLELLRVCKVTHGGIGLDTLRWDGTTLQIADFGRAALDGTGPDGRYLDHADDVYAAGRVIYHVYTGQPPPDDPVELRAQVEHVQDAKLRDLLLRRDLVTRTDLDYVFADDRAKRPTAKVLLGRLDERPHGVQAERLLARDREIQADFRKLRERQQRFRAVYETWAARNPEKTQGALPSPAAAPRARLRPGLVAAYAIAALVVVLIWWVLS